MKTKFKFLCLVVLFGMTASCQNNKQTSADSSKTNTSAQTTTTTQNPFHMDSSYVNKTEEEWKKILTPEQYAILRMKGTERPYTGKYNMHFEKGEYVCAACGYKLFSSGSKFESHCGWPSFDEEIEKGRIKTKVDSAFGMIRTEILCGQCGGHLGHVFDDGPTKTGLRYCVNSVSIDFKPEEKK